MKKNEFIEQLAEFCEFSETDLKADTQFKSLEGYDSLAIMSMVAFVDENFSMKITAAQIKTLTDFNSLIELIGEEKIEND